MPAQALLPLVWGFRMCRKVTEGTGTSNTSITYATIMYATIMPAKAAVGIASRISCSCFARKACRMPVMAEGSARSFFRNVTGSQGNSISTAVFTTFSPTSMAYLSTYLNRANPGCHHALAHVSGAFVNPGCTSSSVTERLLLAVVVAQPKVAFVAYPGPFMYCAAVAFVAVRSIFLFSRGRRAGRALSRDTVITVLRALFVERDLP